MSVSSQELRGLGRELRALLNVPLQASQDLATWDENAANFRKLLDALPTDVYDRLPHGLEHFLNDADIRLKHKGYAESQEAEILSLLAFLDAGELPPDPRRT